MEIGLLAPKDIKEEFILKFKDSGNIRLLDIKHFSEFKICDAIFDLRVFENSVDPSIYAGYEGYIILSGEYFSVAELTYKFPQHAGKLFTTTSYPTLINRSLFEIGSLGGHEENLKTLLSKIGITEYEMVEGRTGLVSPRILSMIINEAFYTVQEGTANKEDINLAMKLGTNYPHGPFEWLELIGIKRIYFTLKSLFEDTGDPRYKICPLLKKVASIKKV